MNDAVLNGLSVKKGGGAQRRPPFGETSFSSLTSFTSWRDYFTISFLTMFTCSPLMRTK